jgi:hypothetical protein
MQRLRNFLGPPLLIGLIYALFSFFFSFLSWGSVEGVRFAPKIDSGLVLHLALHSMAGLLAALPSRRPSLITVGALGPLLLDVDHVGAMLGLPIPGRASHTFIFMSVAAVGMGLLARYSVLGRTSPPLLLSAIAMAILLAHIAVDALYPNAHAPLWAPLVVTEVQLTPLAGVAYQLAAVLLVWIAHLWYSIQGIPGFKMWKAARSLDRDIAGQGRERWHRNP